MTFPGFDGLFGSKDPAQQLAETNERLRKKREQDQRNNSVMPKISGKTIDGVKYLNAAEVSEALRVTDSAIRVRRVIEKYLGNG